MKQNRGKPKKWDWICSGGLILSGLLLQLPFVPELLRERLSPALFMSGAILLLLMWRKTEKFEDLPLEEQRELERRDRDERGQLIYEKTAWLCWRGETLLMCAALILFLLFFDSIPLFSGMDYRSFRQINFWIMILWWARLLIFELIRWLMDRKY